MPAPAKAADSQEGWAKKRLTKFTTSKRFVEETNRTFDDVDLDKSGNINVSELYVAYLLLLHKVNKMPLVGTNEPPTSAEIKATFALYAKPGATTLNREEFLAVCQHLCSTLAKNVTKHIITAFIVCPLIAAAAKIAVRKTVCRAAPAAERALPFVPDSLFLPLAVAAYETGSRVTRA